MMRNCCIPGLLAVLFLCGCSIKEVRDNCLCVVEVDLSLFTELTCGGQWSFDGGKSESFDLQKETVTLDAVKGKHLVCVSGSSGYSISSGKAFVEQAGGGSLFSFHEEIFCEGETYKVSAVPRKEYVGVVLYIDEDDPAGSSVTIRSDYNGLDLRNSLPLRGALEFGPEQIGDGAYRFRLPRQGIDNSLTIIYDSGGDLPVSLPLHKWVADAGFDWEAEDLADINIGALNSFSEISLSITDWKTGFIESITL